MSYIHSQIRAQTAIVDMGAAPEVAKPTGTVEAAAKASAWPTLSLPKKAAGTTSSTTAGDRARAAIAAQQAKKG